MTDAEALDRFEALVLSQQPASAPWEPVTDYSFETRKEIEGKHPELIRDVFRPNFVLDYGAGFGHLVRLLRALNVNVWGYEPHVDMHRESWPNLYGAHIANDFDLVICREVLEHCTIREIRKVVAFLCGVSTRFVYVTTRLNLAPRHMLDVMTSDDLDPTHISMLSPTLLRTLFVLEGFKRRADLETAMDWMKKGRCLVYERAA